MPVYLVSHYSLPVRVIMPANQVSSLVAYFDARTSLEQVLKPRN